MHIILSPLSGAPIYEQIERQIVSAITCGELLQGSALPSIRLMAKELGVGIITVKRAYDDLCADGWCYSLKGKGVFVSGAEELVRYAASGGVGRGKLLKMIGDEGGDSDERR